MRKLLEGRPDRDGVEKRRTGTGEWPGKPNQDCFSSLRSL